MCKCNENNNPCTGGCNNNCKDFSSSCECPVKDLSTDCSTYKGEDLPCSGITKGTILTKVIQDFDAFICNKFAEAINYLNIENIGTGLDIYKGPNNLGTKEFKRIQQGDYIQITDVNDSIRFDNYKSSETQIGSIEIATQAEANAGTDDERAITPLKMKAGVINILEDNSTNITIDPNNLPNATETQKGIAEIATQAEVNALTDDERIITPAKLKLGVEQILQNNNDEGNPALTYLPKFSIIEWGGDINSLPQDWYLCNGQVVAGFATPDKRGKFSVGYDPAVSDYDTPGKLGGSDTNTLGANNVPDHIHRMAVDILGVEDNTFGDGVSSITPANQVYYTSATGSGTQIIDSQPDGDTESIVEDKWVETEGVLGNTGSPAPLDNRPSFYTSVFIIYLPS